MAKYYDRAWNPVSGCRGCFRGCGHCFARVLFSRMEKNHGKSFDDVVINRKQLSKEFHYDTGKIILVCSQSDLFQDEVPDSVIDCIIRKCCMDEKNKYLFLTKYSENMYGYFNSRNRIDEIKGNHFFDFSMKNMYFGVSVCGKEDMHRISDLKETGMIEHRFISFEPLLENVAEEFNEKTMDGIEWVIAGAETGKNHSVSKTSWIAEIVKSADEKKIPVFINSIQTDNGKVTAEFEEMPELLRRNEMPFRMI